MQILLKVGVIVMASVMLAAVLAAVVMLAAVLAAVVVMMASVMLAAVAFVTAGLLAVPVGMRFCDFLVPHLVAFVVGGQLLIRERRLADLVALVAAEIRSIN